MKIFISQLETSNNQKNKTKRFWQH